MGDVWGDAAKDLKGGAGSGASTPATPAGASNSPWAQATNELKGTVASAPLSPAATAQGGTDLGRQAAQAAVSASNPLMGSLVSHLMGLPAVNALVGNAKRAIDTKNPFEMAPGVIGDMAPLVKDAYQGGFHPSIEQQKQAGVDAVNALGSAKHTVARHATALLNGAAGAEKGAVLPGFMMGAGMSEAMQDEDWRAALGGLLAGKAGGALAKILPGAPQVATGALGHVVTKEATPTWAALSRLLHGGSYMGGRAAGYASEGQTMSPQELILGALMTAGSAGHGAWQQAVRSTPGFVAAQVPDAVGKFQGRAPGDVMGGKNTRPIDTKSLASALPDQGAPAIGGFGAGGTATAAPSLPSVTIPSMQDVVNQIRALAGNPTDVATPATTLGAILASRPRKPKPGAPAAPPQAAAPAPAGPTPPPEDDKLKANEDVDAAAGGGGSIGAGPVASPRAGEPVQPVAYGKPVMLQVGDKQYPARYVARNVESYEPSHDPKAGFQANPRYPLENTRNYDRSNKRGDIAGSATPEQFKPLRHTAADPTATNGPGVAAIDPDKYGDIRPLLGGNGRHQRELLVYRADPQGGRGLRDAFLATAKDHFGIDPSELAKIPQPTVKMELNTAGMSPEELRYVIQHLNDSPAAALTPDEAASSMAGGMTHDVADYLGGVLEHNNGSLREVLSDSKGHAVIDRLIKGGVLDKGQRDAYVNASGSVTDFGKDAIERMLNAATYRDADQLGATQPDLRNRIQRIASASLMTRGTPYDLSHELHDAIDVVNKARANNVSVGNIVDNYSMFEAPEYSPATTVLAKELDQASQVNLGKRFRGYAANAARARNVSAEGTVLTPEEALGRIANNGTGTEPVPIRPRPAAEAATPPPIPSPVTPPAGPERSAPAAPAPPVAEQPAGQPGEVPLGDHEIVAHGLNGMLAKSLNKIKGAGGPELEKALADGFKNVPPDNIGLFHDMIDAARAISPQDFEAGSSFVNNTLRNGRADSLGRSTAPAELEAFKRIGDQLGMTPERAESFVEGLHSIRAKLAGETTKSKINLGNARTIDLPDLIGRLERASGYGTPLTPGSAANNAAPAAAPKPAATGGTTAWTGTGALPNQFTPSPTAEELGRKDMARDLIPGYPQPPQPPAAEQAATDAEMRAARAKANSERAAGKAAFQTSQLDEVKGHFNALLRDQYDAGTHTFKPDTKEAFAKLEAKFPGIIKLATAGNQDAFMQYLDNNTSAWQAFNKNAKRDTFNIWGHAPEPFRNLPLIGKLIGASIRVPRPIIGRMQATMDPTSRAAAAMWIASQHPNIPPTFLHAILASLGSASDGSTDKAK